MTIIHWTTVFITHFHTIFASRINLGSGKNLEHAQLIYFLFAIIMAASCDLKYIIDYNIKDAKYSKIKANSEINKQQILEAKNLQIAKGRPNYHKRNHL